MKMEDKMAKLFSCNTSTINVKSEDIDTTKASSTSLRKRPPVTTPSVIVIEDVMTIMINNRHFHRILMVADKNYN